MNYSLNYSFISQKIKEKQPIYSNNQICPKCGSNHSYPTMNMIGSPRYCNNCKNIFYPQISGICKKLKYIFLKISMTPAKH